MKQLLTKAAVIGAAFFSASQFANAANCTLAKEYFEKGLAAGKQAQWQDAKRWLSKSVGECNQFDNWYLLGQTEQQLGNHSAAATAFEDSRRFATQNNERALAIARYAEVLVAQGKTTEPLTLLHEARKLHSNPPEWITKLAKELDLKRLSQPMTVAQVTEGLNNRSIQLLDMKAKPSVNVTINFKSNSTNVTDTSAPNLDVLSKALTDPNLGGKTVWIIGHSDKRGNDDYNLKLSKKRAEAIVNDLVARAPDLKQRLRASGVGEARPLYDGESDDVNVLNRRIEVMVD